VQLLSDNTELPRDLFMEALNRQLNTQVWSQEGVPLQTSQIGSLYVDRGITITYI
jgi:hypothetical protein